MPQFTIELQGLPELDRAMRGMVHASDNLRPVFDQIITDFQRVQTSSFAAGGQPRKWKRTKGGNPTPLVGRTKRLRRSMTGPGPESIRQAFNATLRIGSRVPYAFLNETGRLRPRRSMLAAVTPAVRQRWAELLIDAMTEPWAQGATARFTRSTRRRRRRR